MRPLRVVTANLDFALKPKTVGEDLQRLIDQGEVILFQEGKRVDVDALIKDPAWEVVQWTESDDVQGSGVAYKKARIRAGRSKIRLGVDNRGRKMLNRYIAWVVLYIRDETGEEHPLVVASVHLPPQRYAALYPLYLASIAGFLQLRGFPVLIGGDWNRHKDGLKKFADRVGGTLHMIGIDGFLLVGKKKWKNTGIKQLAETHSDHEPVQGTFLPV